MKVFVILEILHGSIYGQSGGNIVEIFSDWLTAEDARVGLNSQRDNGFVEYVLAEWDVK
jgi:hypothetical protein